MTSIILIEFSLSTLFSLFSHPLCICLTSSPFHFLCNPSLLPFICHFPLSRLLLPCYLGDVLQLKLSHVATLVALSMAAPQAMASTTMMWCTSPATKVTPWKDPPQLSARPTVSGATSRQLAGVRSSHRTPAAYTCKRKFLNFFIEQRLEGLSFEQAAASKLKWNTAWSH